MKEIIDGVGSKRRGPYAKNSPASQRAAEQSAAYIKMTPAELARKIKEMEKEMFDSAQNLEFEKAAVLRDSVEALRAELLELPA